MRPPASRFALTGALLLLVLAWGPCPCVMMRALGLGGPRAAEAGDGSSEAAPASCCCCRKAAANDLAGGEPSAPEPACPCCERFGGRIDVPDGGAPTTLPPPILLGLLPPAAPPCLLSCVVVTVETTPEALGPPGASRTGVVLLN